MTSTSRIIDYIGSGAIADRPAAPSVPTGGAAVYVATDTHVVTFYDGSAWQNVTAGAEYVNAQTGTTYTVVTGDVGKLVTFSNAASIAVTLPHATVAGFGSGFFYDAVNLGAGTVTITPTTSTIDGAATITLTTNQGIRIVSNGTNYFTVRGKSASSGTVTSVASGTGLTGGPVTGSGTLSLDAIADHTVLANTSGGSAAPVSTTVTALIDNALGSTQGDILYRSGSAWTVLAPGTSGYVLTSGGAAANPAWAASAGSGTVTKVSTGTGLTGGDITTTGTVALAAIANHDLLANTSGGSAAPVATTLTAFIDDALGSTQGDILYRNATVWTVLAPGSSGNVLTSGGAGANVSWGAAGGSGTVTSIVAGTGLSGGTITSTGTVALAAIADGDVLGNTSGSSAAPIATTVSALLDKGIASTQGDIAYRNATTWVALAPGTAGQVLQTGGAAANPAWASTVTVNAYTVAGATTWNKPAGCSVVEVIVVGGGGGGGGGAGATVGSVKEGGSGGGGGARVQKTYRASNLSGSYTVTVGAGGGGGNGNSGAGSAGVAGGTSSFGTLVSAYGGGKGGGGPISNTSNAAPGGGGAGGAGADGGGTSSTLGGAPFISAGSNLTGVGGGGAGGASSGSTATGCAEWGGGAGGGAGANAAAGAGGSSLHGGAGGGGGGGFVSSSVNAPAAGGGVNSTTVGGGGSAGAPNGTDGTDGDSTKSGTGGGGGLATNTSATAGGTGGKGGAAGGGGGGGGGGVSTGGNGGAGGDGAIYVFAW